MFKNNKLLTSQWIQTILYSYESIANKYRILSHVPIIFTESNMTFFVMHIWFCFLYSNGKISVPNMVLDRYLWRISKLFYRKVLGTYINNCCSCTVLLCWSFVKYQIYSKLYPLSLSRPQIKNLNAVMLKWLWFWLNVVPELKLIY